MAFKEVLRLVVEADARGAVKAVDDFGNRSERAVSKSEKALDRWGNRLTSIGAGMIGFGAVAIAGLTQAADAASDLNEVANKSATVFGEASGEVDRFASDAAKIGLSKRAALEAASGFGNLFDQLGFASDASADMSIQLTTLASDFASFHNADITEVIEAQTAAFRGEYDSLQRFVPTINAAAVQQQAMAETGKDNAQALTDAEKAAATYTLMIEGAGAATGDFARTSDSAANQQRTLNANWENLKAQLGQGVLPAMQTFLSVTNKAVSGLSDLNAVSDGTLGKVATFGSIGLVAAGGLSVIVGKVVTMRENLKTLATAIGDAGSKLYDLRGGAFQASIGLGALFAAGEGFERLFPIDTADLPKLERDLLSLGQSGRVTGEAADVLGEDLDKLADAMHRVAEPSVTDRIGDISDHIVPGIESSQHALKEARQTIDDVDKALASLAQRDPEAAAAVFEQITDSLKDQGITTSQARDLLDDYDSTLADIDTSEATSGADDFTDAQRRQAEETGRAEEALKEYQDALAATFDPLFGMSDALEDSRQAQADLHAAQLEAIGAEQAMKDAIRDHGAESDEATEATLAFMEAQEGVEAALRTARDSVIDLQGAAAQLKFEMDENGLSAEDAREEFIRMATQMGHTRAEAELMAEDFGFATEEAQRLGQQRPQPRVTAIGTETARERFAAVEHAVRNIPDRRTTSVGTRGVNASRGALGRLQDALDRLHDRTITVGVNMVLNDPTGSKLAALAGVRQHGGPVLGNRLYEVAENSKHEMFESQGHRYLLPGADGRVIPMTQLTAGSAFGGGSGGSYTDQRQINIYTGADPQAVVEAIKRYERSNGRSWRN